MFFERKSVRWMLFFSILSKSIPPGLFLSFTLSIFAMTPTAAESIQPTYLEQWGTCAVLIIRKAHYIKKCKYVQILTYYNVSEVYAGIRTVFI